MKTYYMIFYRYLDSKTWQHSGLDTNQERLRKAIESRPYVDIKSFVIKEVALPE